MGGSSAGDCRAAGTRVRVECEYSGERRLKLRLLLLVLALSALMTIPAAAQSSVTPVPSETPRGSYVVGTDIYVRGGPGETYLPVGRLIAGDTVIPVNRSSDGDWLMIHYSFGFGWIRRDLAYWAVDVDALPTLDQSQLTPTSLYTPTATDLYTATPTGVFVRAGSVGARIRSGPAVRYFPVGAIVSGDQVEPVGRSENGLWILIRYRDDFGWISLDLLSGLDNVDSLPVLLIGALTPSATFTATLTPTITPTPTDTATPSATVTPSPTGTPSATLTPSDTLTATATFAPSDTPSRADTATFTPVPADTLTPSQTPTDTPSATSTLTPVPTATPTLTNTATFTATPSATATLTAIPSATPLPSFTPSETPSVTPSFTLTPSQAPTLAAVAVLADTLAPSASPTFTDTSTATATFTATRTNSPTVTATDTATSTPTPTHTSVPASATLTHTSIAPSSTPTRDATVEQNGAPAVTGTPSPAPTVTDTPKPPTPTNTSAPTKMATATSTLTPTHTNTLTVTRTPNAAVILPGELPTPVSALPAEAQPTPIPPEAIVGGAALILVLIYVGLYWRGLAAADRYAEGFVIERCPICGEGHLIVEIKQSRLVGIPRPRSIVRCDFCRSVLREVGSRRWRYAVDRSANPALYRQLNGKVVDQVALKRLEGQMLAASSTAPAAPPPVRPPAAPPTFIDED